MRTLAFAVVLTGCIPFQGPSPSPAPWIYAPSDAPITTGACYGWRGDNIQTGPGRCMWWKVQRPGQNFYYRHGPYNPTHGVCDFYPQYGDVYVGDDWPPTPYLRVFHPPAAC